MPADDDFYLHAMERPQSAGRRILIAIVLLLFIAVLGGTAWMLLHNRNGGPPATEDSASNAEVAQIPASGASGAAPAAALSAATPDALQARMLDLEQRVVRTAAAAQAASGYANRAEAIMVAFAARRSLEAGSPLGYLEGQLRVLFGEAQPKAVATIINAASDPVTVNKLRAGLDDINLLVEKGDPKEGWWSGTMRRLGNLVVIRRAGTPPPEPLQRLTRARRDIESGQVEGAIAELAALPPQPAIAQWLEQARRYNEAHRALDVIEAAAILEPRTTPMVTAPAAAASEEKPAEEKPKP